MATRAFIATGFLLLAIAVAVGYVLESGYRAGQWVDRVFLSLVREWDADVIVKNARNRPARRNDRQELQKALDELGRLQLDRLSDAACTHGLHYSSEGGLDFRSRCVTRAVFAQGTVRFDVEVKGFWNDWKITSFSFRPETPDTKPRSG